jgi:hypothetical protein
VRPRGNTARDWDSLHWSIIVHHWRDASAAVSVLAKQLKAWNVSQSLEVSVEAIGCGAGESTRSAME